MGLALKFHEPDRPWAGWQVPGQARPLFVICKPHDGRPHDPGNGQMVAFAATRPAVVRAAHAAGLAARGACDGPPGLKPHDHAHYSGACLRGPEGNKLGLASHTEGE